MFAFANKMILYVIRLIKSGQVFSYILNTTMELVPNTKEHAIFLLFFISDYSQYFTAMVCDLVSLNQGWNVPRIFRFLFLKKINTIFATHIQQTGVWKQSLFNSKCKKWKNTFAKVNSWLSMECNNNGRIHHSTNVLQLEFIDRK